MTLAFAAIAAMIRGDQEKWLRMGGLMSEGYISRSLNELPNHFEPESDYYLRPMKVGLTHQKSKIWLDYSFTSTHRSSIRSRKLSHSWRIVAADAPDSRALNASRSIIVRLGLTSLKSTGVELLRKWKRVTSHRACNNIVVTSMRRTHI